MARRTTRPICQVQYPRVSYPRSFIVNYEKNHEEYESLMKEKAAKAIKKEQEKRLGVFWTIIIFFSAAHFLFLLEWLFFWRKL